MGSAISRATPFTEKPRPVGRGFFVRQSWYGKVVQSSRVTYLVAVKLLLLALSLLLGPAPKPARPVYVC